MSDSDGRRWGLDAARVAALVGAVVVHGVWLLSLAEAWGTEELVRRDWWVFWDAGRRLLSGELAGIYDARPGGFPFLHPPPVITLSAVLGGLDGAAAYAVVLAAQLAGLVVAVVALRALCPRRGEHDVVWLATLASAPWGIAVVLGQPTALLLAGWLVGLWAWRGERDVLAGIAFSVCLLKPPFVVAPIALALVRRRWRVLAGLGAGAAALLVISLPAGLARWPEWLAATARAMGELDAGALSLWKQHTWLAFVRSVAPAGAARVLWAIVALPLGAWTLRRLRGVDSRSVDSRSVDSRSVDSRGMLRVGAALALATIALGPYAYFYDALLLVVPAAALWLARDRYPRRWLGALAAVAGSTFVAQHVAFFVVQGGPATGGALVTVWLVLELGAPAPSPGGAD